VSATSNSAQVVVQSPSGAEDPDRVFLSANGTMDLFVSLKPSMLKNAWAGVCGMLKAGVIVACDMGSEEIDQLQSEWLLEES
jgi:hypothetical protein